MAETVTFEGQQYLKRNPLGVLGLSLITLGVYFFIWYYKINDELRRSEHDLTISPTRSLMAMLFGWLLIVPPFIAMYNTAKHVQSMEARRGVAQTVEPVIALLLMFVFSVGNSAYLQDHLNRGWDAAGRTVVSDTTPCAPVATG
jgi:drug/metabolite transporter (DMT)-like permease